MLSFTGTPARTTIGVEMDEQNEMNPQEGDDDRTPQDWGRFRREEKARKEAEKGLADARRELAFHRAGIDPGDERMGYFVRGYDGDVTPDKIREAATAAGFLTQQAPQNPAATQSATDLAQIDAAADGAQTPDGGNPVSHLDEAFSSGGDAAVEQQLRQMGIPVNYSS